MPEHVRRDLESNLGFLAGAASSLAKPYGVNRPPRSEAKPRHASDSITSARLGTEWRAMPTAVGFSQKEVFEDELRLADRKRSGAGWARYPRIDAVR